jgi:hypothetical protein
LILLGFVLPRLIKRCGKRAENYARRRGAQAKAAVEKAAAEVHRVLKAAALKVWAGLCWLARTVAEPFVVAGKTFGSEILTPVKRAIIDDAVKPTRELSNSFWEEFKDKMMQAILIAVIICILAAVALLALSTTESNDFCLQNQHVVDEECVACPSGETNKSGDDPAKGNTDCKPEEEEEEEEEATEEATDDSTIIIIFGSVVGIIVSVCICLPFQKYIQPRINNFILE